VTRSLLPEGFEALELFAGKWAGTTAAERAALRSDSDPKDVAAFHATASAFLQPALELLDRKKLTQHDARETRLMNLMLTFAHVSLGVEEQGPDEVMARRKGRRMRIVRATADQAPA